MAFEVPAELEKKMDEAISHYPVSKRSAVLPLLHLMQHHFRYISEEAVNWVAAKLGLEPIQVLEVVTFYPGFRQSAPGKFHIRVCRTLSCAMAGSPPSASNARASTWRRSGRAGRKGDVFMSGLRRRSGWGASFSHDIFMTDS